MKAVAHRVAYVLVNGWIEEDVILRHSCDNPPCCRPDHLIPGTHISNVADKVAKDRQAKGEANGRSKLVDRDVRRIRRLLAKGVPKTVIGKRFDVDPKVIFLIDTGRIWTHVP